MVKFLKQTINKHSPHWKTASDSVDNGTKLSDNSRVRSEGNASVPNRARKSPVLIRTPCVQVAIMGDSGVMMAIIC